MFPGGHFQGDTYKLTKSKAEEFWRRSFGNKYVPYFQDEPMGSFPWFVPCFVHFVLTGALCRGIISNSS